MKLLTDIGVKFWLISSSSQKRDSESLDFLIELSLMNLRSVLPSLAATFRPDATASMIFSFSFSLSLSLSVEMLMTFLAGLGFLVSLGRLALRLWYYQLRLTSRTAGSLDCFLREGLPCIAEASLLGRHTLLEWIIFFFSKLTIYCSCPMSSCSDPTRLNSKVGTVYLSFFDLLLFKMKDCWFSRWRNQTSLTSSNSRYMICSCSWNVWRSMASFLNSWICLLMSYFSLLSVSSSLCCIKVTVSMTCLQNRLISIDRSRKHDSRQLSSPSSLSTAFLLSSCPSTIFLRDSFRTARSACAFSLIKHALWYRCVESEHSMQIRTFSFSQQASNFLRCVLQRCSCSLI